MSKPPLGFVPEPLVLPLSSVLPSRKTPEGLLASRKFKQITASIEAVGLIDCFAGFSTFAAKPLLNVHDIVVHASRRGQGIAQALLAWAGQRAGEALARQQGLQALWARCAPTALPHGRA